MNRYRVITIALLTLALLMSALPGTLAQDNMDIYGRELPADAAPYEMQVYRNLCDSARQETSLSSITSVYSRICDTRAFDKFSDSLVVLDNNMNIIPSAATSWSVSEDGMTWDLQPARRPDVERRHARHRQRLGRELALHGRSGQRL